MLRKHLNLVANFEKIPFPETIKVRIGGFFGVRRAERVIMNLQLEVSQSIMVASARCILV